MSRSTLAAKTLTRPKPGQGGPRGGGQSGRQRRRGSRRSTGRTESQVPHPAGRAEGFRKIALLLIKYRMDKGLSQEELAELVGTSHSQISRIESGRHRTNLDTLSRMAHALDLRMVLGFESTTSSGRAKRDLVTF